MDTVLEIPYKGARDYLHGTDFFSELSALADEITEQDGSYIERLTFRSVARKMCKISLTKPDEHKKVIGQVRYRTKRNNGHVDGWLIESEVTVLSRYEFDEAVITDSASLDKEGRSATLHSGSGYAPIEDIIILTKYLNYSISPITSGKWLFGQIDLLESLSSDYQLLEIRMTSLIAHKFSVSDIFIDGRKIGMIRFIVGAV